jgi:hypothetical protein
VNVNEFVPVEVHPFEVPETVKTSPLETLFTKVVVALAGP